MTITLLTGPAGSGKSKHLIEKVNAARASGQVVRTFLSRRAVIGAPDPNLWQHGVIGSRDPSLTTLLDHIVSVEECGEILGSLRRGSLAAFDEAFYFDAAVADHWSNAAQRGVDILISTPSTDQLRKLATAETVEKRMTVRCQTCKRRDATDSFLLPGNDDATSVCGECATALVRAARTDLVSRLQSQAPYPGEQAIYQPVPLEECANWQILRRDSAARAELQLSAVREREAEAGVRLESYLDVGCNTGYFCSAMSRAGLEAIGVDVVDEDIEVATLLTAAIRRDRCQFIVADVYDYLRDTHEHQIDVISAYSVMQWLILQRSLEDGEEAIRWLFEKAGHICILEMGYPTEDIYRDKLPSIISQEWVRALMVDSGRFAEVRCIPAGDRGLMRDVFIGFVATGARTSVVTEGGPAQREESISQLAPAVRRHILGAPDYFRQWERYGLHVTPVSFYEPIPDLSDLPDTLWDGPSPLRGIDMNEVEQVRLLVEVFPITLASILETACLTELMP
jgi:SAM-dependent methyltransferase/thymidine kinase